MQDSIRERQEFLRIIFERRATRLRIDIENEMKKNEELKIKNLIIDPISVCNSSCFFYF